MIWITILWNSLHTIHCPHCHACSKHLSVSQSNDALYELDLLLPPLFSVLAQYYAMSKSLNECSQWTERYIPLHDLTLESNEKSL